MSKMLKVALGASFFLALVSCGGGGSGSGTVSTNIGYGVPHPGDPGYDQFEQDVNDFVITHQEDYSGGGQATFEETGATTKDLAKVQGLKQVRKIENMAKNLHLEFGLNEQRSLELARLSLKISDSPKRSMTPADYLALTGEVFGSSALKINLALAKAATGDTQELNDVIDRAAVVNGIGPEHARVIFLNLINNY